MEQPLLPAVGIHQSDLLVAAPGHAQVAQCLHIDGKYPACCTVLGSHIGNRCAVSQRQLGESLAEELNKLSDDAGLTQHLCDGQHQISSCRAFLELACEFEPDDLRDQHRDWLTKHRSLGLDAAYTPAQ